MQFPLVSSLVSTLVGFSLYFYFQFYFYFHFQYSRLALPIELHHNTSFCNSKPNNQEVSTYLGGKQSLMCFIVVHLLPEGMRVLLKVMGFLV